MTYGRRGTAIVSLVPQPHYPGGKSCKYVSSRRLDGPQGKCGCCGYQTDLLPLPGIKHHILVTILTEPPTHCQLPFSLFPHSLQAKSRAVCYHSSYILSHHLSQSQFVTIYEPEHKKITKSFIKHLKATKTFAVIIVIIFQWFWCVITQHINCRCCHWPRMEVLCSSRVSTF